MVLDATGLFVADAGKSTFPPDKAIALMAFFGAVGVASLCGLFASKETLHAMSGFIGTKNPIFARIVCALGVVVGAGAVFVATLALLGKT